MQKALLKEHTPRSKNELYERNSKGLPCALESTFVGHPGHSCSNSFDYSQLLGSTNESIDLAEEMDTVLKRQHWLPINLWFCIVTSEFETKHAATPTPHINRLLNGLQNVLLGEKLAFIPQTEQFVQIFNEKMNHWITLYLQLVAHAPSTVNVYDSLHGSLSSHTQWIIADILQSQATQIAVKLQDVQWQGNSHDCGLFELDSAMSMQCCIHSRRYAKTLSWCCWTRFSPTPSLVKNRRQILDIVVFCICRLPDNGEKMVECTSCKGWFHTQCVQLFV